MLELLGQKALAALAGLAGGAISGGVMPGPLAALSALWMRVATGAWCGSMIAFFGAEPLARALQRPDYLEGIALGLGLFGLSFIFKMLKAWNDLELSAPLQKLVDKIFGGFGK